MKIYEVETPAGAQQVNALNAQASKARDQARLVKAQQRLKRAQQALSKARLPRPDRAAGSQ